MCLEVRTKQTKTQFILLLNWNPCGTRKAYHNSKWQAERSWGKHDVTEPIATGFKENKSCHESDKWGVAKIFSDESAMKWISKYLPYDRLYKSNLNSQLFTYGERVYIRKTGVHFEGATLGLASKTLCNIHLNFWQKNY